MHKTVYLQQENQMLQQKVLDLKQQNFDNKFRLECLYKKLDKLQSDYDFVKQSREPRPPSQEQHKK